MTRRFADRFAMRALAIASLLLSCALPRVASPAALSYDGSIDVTAALAEAGRVWDLGQQDAVFLLESARLTRFADGRHREERHRLLWISTDFAQETYADFRLPWDSDRQTLEVKALRVLRDGRWIEARPTAIVDTTPFALRNAPDYAGIRETMLLYDGVELPCVLECAYVIEDKVPFRAGFDGVWTFRHADPALESRLVLAAPAEASLRSAAVDGAPEGARATENGLATTTYVMKRLDAAPDLAGEDPAADLPRVTWSTFGSWSELGRSVSAALAEKLTLGPVLTDSLAAVIEGAENTFRRAQRIAGFVRERQRHIDYDPAFLSALARPASRVFDSGYGGNHDLVILAGALFRGAGFTVEPAFVGKGRGPVDEGLPTLGRMGRPVLRVSRQDDDGGCEAFWDPEGGRLVHEETGLAGHAVWRVDSGLAPAVREGAGEILSRSATYLDLRWDATKKTWTGTAWFEARGAANPYDDIIEGHGATQEAFAKALNEAMGGLEPVSIDPVSVGPGAFAVQAEVRSDEASRDAQGRVALVLGASAGGIAGSLPHDVVLQAEDRSLPLSGISGDHVLRVRLDLGGLEVVHLPGPATIRNETGQYEFDVKQDQGTLIITQSVRVAPGSVPPSQWPLLRALLLAEGDRAARTVLLR